MMHATKQFTRFVAVIVVAALTNAERLHAADAQSRPVVLELEPIPAPQLSASAGAAAPRPAPRLEFAPPQIPMPVPPRMLKLPRVTVRVSISCSIDHETGRWQCVRTVEAIERDGDER